MAIKIYPTPSIIRAIREGLSANESLRQFRAAGGSIRRSVWLRLYADTKANIDARGGELTASLDAFPGGRDVQVFDTVNARGVLQQVEISYRIKGSDQIETRPFSLTGTEFVTRQQAIEEALRVYGDAVSSGQYEEQVILGATYVGSYIMQPGAVA